MFNFTAVTDTEITARERAFVSEILWCMTRLNSSEYAGIDAAHRFGLDVGY